MNSVDIILAIPLIIGLIFGFLRGFVEEIIRLLVLIGGVMLAYLFGHLLSSWLLQIFHWKEWICNIISYTLIFILFAIIITLIGKLINKLLHAIHLDLFNKILGAAFGTIKWGLILALLVTGFNFLNTQFDLINQSTLHKSILYNFFLEAGNTILNHINQLFS